MLTNQNNNNTYPDAVDYLFSCHLVDMFSLDEEGTIYRHFIVFPNANLPPCLC